MAVTDVNSLIKTMGQSQNILPFYKEGVTAFGAGALHSLWTAGGEPSAGSVPVYNAGYPISTTAGSLPMVNSAVVKTHVARLSFNAATPGYYLLYDRVSHSGGLVGNVATSQAIYSTSATAGRTANNGVGCRMYVEWYTSTGTGTPTLTVTYTNSNNTGGRTGTVVWPASPVAGQMLRVALQAGDIGVRSVQSVQLSGATSAAGSWGITIINPILDVYIPIAGGVSIQDAIGCGLPSVYIDSALAWMFMATATTHGAIFGQITLIDA